MSERLPDFPEPLPVPTYDNGMWADWEKQRAEAWEARCRLLHKAIKHHNDACEQACGIGDQEGVACKYRPYFPRHCPDCMRDHMIVTPYDERLELSVGELP